MAFVLLGLVCFIVFLFIGSVAPLRGLCWSSVTLWVLCWFKWFSFGCGFHLVSINLIYVICIKYKLIVLNRINYLH